MQALGTGLPRANTSERRVKAKQNTPTTRAHTNGKEGEEAHTHPPALRETYVTRRSRLAVGKPHTPSDCVEDLQAGHGPHGAGADAGSDVDTDATISGSTIAPQSRDVHCVARVTKTKRRHS